MTWFEYANLRDILQGARIQSFDCVNSIIRTQHSHLRYIHKQAKQQKQPDLEVFVVKCLFSWISSCQTLPLLGSAKPLQYKKSIIQNRHHGGIKGSELISSKEKSSLFGGIKCSSQDDVKVD